MFSGLGRCFCGSGLVHALQKSLLCRNEQPVWEFE